MAATHVIVTLQWEETEADGSECQLCGDPCYLTMFTLMCFAGRRRLTPPQDLRIYLCGSCYDVAIDVKDEHSGT